MKIFADDVLIFEISDTDYKILADEISEDKLNEEIKRRIKWIITHKIEGCFKRLKQEWEPKLVTAGYDSLPTNRDKYADLVFKHPLHKNRKKRDSIGERSVKQWDNEADGPMPRK